MSAQEQDPADNPRRLDTIKDRLREGFVDDDGNPPSDDELTEVVEEQAAQYEEAPIQDFAILLTEHDSRDELRERGLHARLGGAGDVVSGDVD